jgi:hypothetical protein
MMKLLFAFHNFVNACKKHIKPLYILSLGNAAPNYICTVSVLVKTSVIKINMNKSLFNMSI